ncbi:MAG: dihydropteroate synthase [Treponema sp.]|nr:dihydropteroate synthase [Treponema sp.]
MSIINCTPDSFYPPSRTFTPEEAAERAFVAESEGADIVDFGAESTRPGYIPIDEEEEIRRLIPALRLFRRQSSLPVSVDTQKTTVARLALDEGADIINDVSPLSDKGIISLCAEKNAALVLVHNGSASETHKFLHTMAEQGIEAGMEKANIIFDPGFGFGKSTNDNIFLLNRLETIKHEDYPLLVGLSHKRFIGELTGKEEEGRLAGTITANALAIIGGANIIRVHDTAAALDMVKVISAVKKEARQG